MQSKNKIALAWTAGIIDADGCVTMRGARGVSRCPQIVVDNTDREILDELVRLYGGSLIIKKKTKEHHRQAWTWRLHGSNNILDFLEQVLPFMRCRVKVDRGTLLVSEYRSVTPKNGRYTDAQKEAKADFVQRFMNIGAGRGSQCKQTP